jgi:RNA polymerase sigma-70 factor, ECF subfamily
MLVVDAGLPHVSFGIDQIDGRSTNPAGPMPAGRVDSWHDRFDELVGPRIGRLRRLARRILRSEDLADDAVQETLLCLWREGRLPPNPDGWLVRTVINRSLHLNRSRRRRRAHEERAAARRPEHDPEGDASRPLEVAEIASAIDVALAALPEHLRGVFVLREAEQLDYESIAKVLRVPLGTVRSRLHRAREALQDALGAGAQGAVSHRAARRIAGISHGTFREEKALT